MKPDFRDRVEAGQMLAPKLEHYARRDDVIVLALPRGGVPVAFEVACRLHVPLDVLVVRKLGVEHQEELAFGAIAADGVRVLDSSVINALQIAPETIEKIARREAVELERREYVYRGGRPFGRLDGLVAILVDDGIATGSTMRAAIDVVRQKGARAIVVATPVVSVEAVEMLRPEVEEMIALVVAEAMHAIGQFYGDFSATTDDEVKTLLIRANTRIGSRRNTVEAGGSS